MATRFRKHSTRKTRRSKSLKTRKHRGGDLFHRKKSSTGNMMGSAGNAHTFLGIKKKGFFNKMKSFFTRKEKQDGGNFLTDMLRPKSPLSSSSSSPSSPKPNTTKKNTMTMYHTSNYTSKNFETKDQFVKKQKWRGYLETLEKQIKNMSPEKRNEMKQSLHNQLNQNNKILNSMKKNLGSGAISEIQTRLSTIRSLLA